MGRRRRRTPELREHFVVVATQLVEQDGADALTTRRLAAEAGSSLAAINELFGSKRGVLDAVALRGFGALAEQLELDRRGSDARARLLDLADAYRRFIVDHPHLATLMFSRPFAAFDPDDADVDVAARIRRAFTTAIAELLGLERSADIVFDLSVGLVSLIDGLARQEQSGVLGSSPASIERRFETAVSSYLSGAERQGPDAPT